MILIFNNPIYAVFSFVLIIINLVTILIILGVEFMAIIYVLVYLGAIVVLFLFILMMVELRYPIIHNLSFKEYCIIRLFFFKTMLLIMFSIYYNFFSLILLKCHYKKLYYLQVNT
jgi:NADH:ubiquinone oxidoreductase subunit 6 (subunit J)